MTSSETSLTPPTLLALLDATKALIRKPALDQVLQHVAEQAATVLNAEGASVLLLDEQRQKLVFRAATGPKGPQLRGETFDATLGIAGEAIREKRMITVDDVRNDPHFFEAIDAKTHMQTRTLIAAPLKGTDNILGVVEVINPINREKFSREDQHLLELFTNLATAAVHIGQSYDRVQRNNLGLQQGNPAPQIIGRAAPIQQALDLCRRVAPSNATVLLTGETGTGKELFARAIHDFSNRKENPFIAINCAALPESLLESELFGHEKGAFTGAGARKLGRFELADSGSVFLYELGEMSPAIQAKLLRVLQEREFIRVGGTQTVTSDVRVVAATNRDLRKEVEENRFRSDLFYRLNVFPIHLPALRERIEDIPLLVDHFITQLVPSLGIAPPQIDDDVTAALTRYEWPGNIRELRNIIERCALLASDSRITLQHLPPEMVGTEQAADTDAAPADADADAGAGSKLAAQEKMLILRALREQNWNQSAAARNLGVSRDHLRYRLKKYGLRRSETVAGE